MSLKINKIVNELNNGGSISSPMISYTKKNLIQRNRILDETSRNRRIKQQINQLENDNFHDDPHANLVMHKKAPKFDDTINTPVSVGRKPNSTFQFRPKFLTLNVMIEDDLHQNPDVNYTNAAAPSLNSIFFNTNNDRIKKYDDWLTEQLEKKNTKNNTNINNNKSLEYDTDDSDSFMQFEEDKKLNNDKIKNCQINNEKKYLFKTNNINETNNFERRLLIVNRRKFCCVCGFQANYTCTICGVRYCSISCLQTHKDTRCLKWTV